MVIGKQFEPPDLIVATLGGVITAVDQNEIVDWVRTGIRHLGKVRVLIAFDEFIGWMPGAGLDNKRSWFSDDESVSQLAIVGSPEWRRTVLTLIAHPIRMLPIRYFETEPEARRWLKVEPLEERASSAI
jgi:hypothetical protein